MASNSIGRFFVVTCSGESHGRCIGVVVDGCSPGLRLSERDIQLELDRRRPVLEGVSTPRREQDKVEILSGVFKGCTTGAPIHLIIWNRDPQPDAYEEFRCKPRPGHADYPAWIRYGGYSDYRGGGIFSARTTVGFVAAGAIAKKLLRQWHIEVFAHVVEIGGIRVRIQLTPAEIRAKTYASQLRCVDPKAGKEMQKAILAARQDGDSLGGIVECLTLNLPPGIGDPIFHSLDADLARFLFCIPAVKGVEFGAGFNAARLRGSENNDQYAVRHGHVVTLTNNAGGILGGLSTGMPLVVRIAFKPVSSIPRRQKTVDLHRLKNTTIEVKGRHDVCVVPRAVPIVEAVVANVLVDHMLAARRSV